MTRTQDEFVSARKQAWAELEGLLSGRRFHKLPPASIVSVPPADRTSPLAVPPEATVSLPPLPMIVARALPPA